MAGVRTSNHDKKYGSQDVLQCLCAVFAVDAGFPGTCSVCDLKQCQKGSIWLIRVYFT